MRSYAAYLAILALGAVMGCNQTGDRQASAEPTVPVPTVIDLGVYGAVGPVIGQLESSKSASVQPR